MVLAIWNIRTLLTSGKMQQIGEEICKNGVDIAAVQEIRWQGKGKIQKPEYTLFYSGSEERTGLHGTGFFVTKKMTDRILQFEPIDERICKIRLKGKFRNVTIINVYAPTEDKEQAVKEEFYEKLEKTYNTIPKHDMVLIASD